MIEDHFVSGRPDWDKAGAQLVQDVLPFEQMKLRMLNGSHSFLAYLGYLAGYEHISDCMADDAFRAAARALMVNEQAPTLTIQDVDLSAYADALIARFANRRLSIGLIRLRPTGPRSCPSAFSTACVGIWTTARRVPCCCWASRPGCAMSAQWTKKASPSRSAIR